ncbi:MAG: DNA primase DnaG [Nanoarchaeota archaeon]|nr:DNA primase DnaG [Nanoarchaeota archaeon]
MAKISPVSIKYMIHANFTAEGALEKPDVIGALFGQTEGLLGADLEMRELQKEGKIGRIEVDLQRNDRRTTGTIKIPTALDQSETTLIAAAIETIERIGPSDAQLEVERIEDVRGSKRDYIIERAKKLMGGIQGSANSREISNEIKDSARISDVQEYGDEKLPSGDLSGNEIIVVEGRADVLNLMRAGVKNVIAMNGTKLPGSVKKLSEEKEVTLFVDGDRGGKLIIQNVVDNARVKYIAIAPDGKEVEELTGKEVLMNLRKKIPVREFLSREKFSNRYSGKSEKSEDPDLSGNTEKDSLKDSKKDMNNIEEKLKEISRKNKGTGKSVLVNEDLEAVKSISTKALASTLKRLREKPFAIVIDGTATNSIINSAEDARCQIIVAKNFATTDTKIKLMSF